LISANYNRTAVTNFSILNGGSYEVSFSGSFTPSLTICFTYDEADIHTNEDNLRLFHGPTPWDDVTISLDTNKNKICGSVDSLSPFVIAEPTSSSTTTKVPIQNSLWLIPSVLGGLYLLRRRKGVSA